MAQRSTAELAKRLAKQRSAAGHDEPLATTRMPAYLSTAHNKAWSSSARKSKRSVEDSTSSGPGTDDTCGAPSGLGGVTTLMVTTSTKADSEEPAPPELWTMRPTANAFFEVPTRSPERLPACEASIRRADTQARDASIQHVYDLAQRTLQDPWTRRHAPETRTLSERHHEHRGVESAADAGLPEAPLVVPLAPELLSRAREMGIEAPGQSARSGRGGF